MITKRYNQKGKWLSKTKKTTYSYRCCVLSRGWNYDRARHVLSLFWTAWNKFSRLYNNSVKIVNIEWRKRDVIPLCSTSSLPYQEEEGVEAKGRKFYAHPHKYSITIYNFTIIINLYIIIDVNDYWLCKLRIKIRVTYIISTWYNLHTI